MSNALPQPLRYQLNKLLDSVGDMSLKRRARRLIEELNPQNGDKIVDLGCGDGYYLHLLSSLSLKLNLTGFDSDRVAVSHALSYLKGKKVRFIYGDLNNMPFKNNEFDKVVLSEVIEHLGNDKKTLKEINRILKPGGALLLTTSSYNFPLLWDPVNWTLQHLFGVHIKSGFFSGIWNNHIRLYKLADLVKMVKDAGFEVDVAQELTSWSLPFNHYLVNIVARLLYDIQLPSVLSDSISKFKLAKQPLLVRIIFSAINYYDKLNDWFPRKHGVNILIKASKPGRKEKLSR